MAVLEVVINSKVYQIGCGEGEESYVTSMVNDLNKRINKLKEQNPGFFDKLNEERLFLYQLLVLCNEIRDLKKHKKTSKTTINHDGHLPLKDVSRINNSINNLKKALNHLDSLIKPA